MERFIVRQLLIPSLSTLALVDALIILPAKARSQVVSRIILQSLLKNIQNKQDILPVLVHWSLFVECLNKFSYVFKNNLEKRSPFDSNNKGTTIIEIYSVVLTTEHFPLAFIVVAIWVVRNRSDIFDETLRWKVGIT